MALEFELQRVRSTESLKLSRQLGRKGHLRAVVGRLSSSVPSVGHVSSEARSKHDPSDLVDEAVDDDDDSNVDNAVDTKQQRCHS